MMSAYSRFIHGGDVSRGAFVGDVVDVLDEVVPGQRCVLVGQSMGAHTAFLAAAARPDLVDRLVMLEGHAAGSENPDGAAALRRYFASWPTPFPDEASARAFLGDDPIVNAWVTDLEVTPEGLMTRFDADIMERTILEAHAARWAEGETLEVPTLAVFAAHGMFSDEDKEELIRRRLQTDRIDLATGSHDAHLDAFKEWVDALQGWLGPRGESSPT